MAIEIPPGYSEISVVHSPENVYGSSPTWTLGVTGTDATSIFAALYPWLNGTYSAQLSISLNITNVRIAGNTTYLDFPLAQSGDRISGNPPINTAVLVQKKTPLSGRKRRGRFFLPAFVDVAEVDDAGLMSTDEQANIQAIVDELMLDLTTAGHDPVILHADGSAPNPIVALRVQRLLATQRRRLRG